MKAAKAIARENPKNRVLLVCTELCSLHMQLDDRVENLVASVFPCFPFACLGLLRLCTRNRRCSPTEVLP